MSVGSPGPYKGPQPDSLGAKDKPKADGKFDPVVHDRVKPESDQLPPASVGARTSFREITNIPPETDLEKRIESAAQTITPQKSEDEELADRLEERLHATLETLGVVIPSVIKKADPKTIKRFDLYATDPKVDRKVALLLALERNTTIDSGRKLLLAEMVKKPSQIIDDLPRFPEVAIGKKIIKQEGEAGVAKTFINIGAALLDHISSINDDPKIHQNAFDAIDELFYVTAQTFFEPVGKLEESDPRLREQTEDGNDKWVPVKAVKSTTYEMEKTYISAPKILIITRRVEKTYVSPIEDTGERMALVMQVQCHYNLSNNKVEFKYEYSLEGKKITWTHNRAAPPSFPR